MRRPIRLLALTVLAACGSGSDSPGIVTPPPPTKTPASIAVQSGDGQLAEPGAPVPIKPSVVVRDASGSPVSGVAVTFAVDSGGGSLSSGQVTSGANGVATAGDWILGPSEGRNLLRVTVGSLTPVKIVATAQITAVTLPTVTIGAGGGSYTVAQPGPLNGFRLTVPGGAFPAGIQATVSYASNSTVPAKMAVSAVGPAIKIATATTGYARSPLTIHIAVVLPANTFPVIRMYDPLTGANESMTTVSYDANGVTAITGHLNSVNFLAASGVGAVADWASSRDPEPGVTLIVDAVPTSLLNQDFDTGFRPEVDGWEFGVLADAKGAVPVAAQGPTALWYFNTKQGPQRLFGRFLKTPGNPLSNRAGIRWVSELDNSWKNSLADAVANLIAGPTSDANQFNLLRANFVRDLQKGVPPTPQLIALTNLSSVTLPVVAYRVQGRQVFVYDPTRPGDATRFIDFPVGGVASYTAAGFTLSSFRDPLVSGATLFLPISQLPVTYAQVLDGTIGKNVFPDYEIHGWTGRLYDTLYVVDTLRAWVSCPTCESGFPGTATPTVTDKLGGQTVYDLGSSNSQGFYVSTLRFGTSSLALGTDRPLEAVVWGALGTDASQGWLDWRKFTLRRLLTSITPATPTGNVSIPLSLKHQVTIALLPSQVRYRWDFGDGKPKVTVDNNQNVQHTYDAIGTYPVTSDIIDLRNNQVIAKATETVTITVPQFAWQFTSVTLTGSQLPGPITDPEDLQIQGFFNTMIGSLQGTPQNSLFYVQNTGSCRSLFLEQFAPGQFAPILDSTFGGAIKGVMATNCPDPEGDFISSFTMGTLGSGTMVGSFVDIPKAESFVLPGGSINATMSGTTLSGTFTWRARYSIGYAVYSFTFQGTQVLPIP